MSTYVVAGASRGLGLELTVQLLARGNTVIALARTPEKSAGLKAISDKNLHIVQADITDAASLEAAASKTASITGGSLDVLINNAAHMDFQTYFAKVDQFPNTTSLVDEFNTAWKTNVIGTLQTTTSFLPLLKKGSTKKVMTLSTGLGDLQFNLDTEFPYAASYATTKAAADMVMAKFAMSLKKEGFTFFSISPGVVNTATEAPPAEAMPLMMGMIKSFQAAYPDWDGNPISPTQSVNMILPILDSFKKEDTGKVVSVYGGQKWL